MGKVNIFHYFLLNMDIIKRVAKLLNTFPNKLQLTVSCCLTRLSLSMIICMYGEHCWRRRQIPQNSVIYVTHPSDNLRLLSIFIPQDSGHYLHIRYNHIGGEEGNIICVMKTMKKTADGRTRCQTENIQTRRLHFMSSSQLVSLRANFALHSNGLVLL